MTWPITLSSNGQITLPKEARDRLGAVPGDTIPLIERRGRFEFEAYGGDILRWYGALETVFLPEAALCDAVRALSTVHGWPAGRVAAFAGNLLALDGVLMQRKDLLWNALSRFKEEGLDFQAALIAAETAAMGLVEICSYDRDFDRVAGVARVEP